MIIQARKTRSVEDLPEKLWSGLECIASGEALMADWKTVLGSAWDWLRPFLKPTQTLTRTCPCTARPPCECRHEVVETEEGLAAVCACEPRDCEPFNIERMDILIYALDRKEFGET